MSLGYQKRANDTEIRLRPHQLAQWADKHRFQVLVWNRRAGKTLYLVLRQLVEALNGPDDWQGAYLAPTLKQARTIAEPYLVQFASPIGGNYNKGENILHLGNRKLHLASGENYERLRGLFLNNVVIDEAAQIPSAAWSQVISPAISDREGKVTFCGTPAGHMNLLYRLYDYASTKEDPDWSATRLTWRDTGAPSAAEVERNRRLMTDAEFRQEMECSFEGALLGAFYAAQMQAVTDDGRVSSRVRYDPTLPVFAALDLGHSNATVIVCAQRAGQELRILHSEGYTGTAFPEMVRKWREFPFPIDELILPHDARVTELGTGKTRQEVLESLGLRTSIAPKQSIDEGIAQVRNALANTWFNTAGTEMLREALISYRAEHDDVRQVFKLKPLHDWSSDWADAFRYLVVGESGTIGNHWGERPAFKGAI